LLMSHIRSIAIAKGQQGKKGKTVAAARMTINWLDDDVMDEEMTA
jgi:hypothetical protein